MRRPGPPSAQIFLFQLWQSRIVGLADECLAGGANHLNLAVPHRCPDFDRYTSRPRFGMSQVYEMFETLDGLGTRKPPEASGSSSASSGSGSLASELAS
jgi:hypothetical protein